MPKKYDELLLLLPPLLPLLLLLLLLEVVEGSVCQFVLFYFCFYLKKAITCKIQRFIFLFEESDDMPKFRHEDEISPQELISKHVIA